MTTPGAVAESDSPATVEAAAQPPARDRYRIALLAILSTAAFGAAMAVVGGIALRNPVLLDAAVTLGMASGMLLGVFLSQTARLNPVPSQATKAAPLEPDRDPAPGAIAGPAEEATAEKASEGGRHLPVDRLVIDFMNRARAWTPDAQLIRNVALTTALLGALATALIWQLGFTADVALTAVNAALGVAGCGLGVGLAATVVGYLADIRPADLPEGRTLCQGGRVVGWILFLASLSMLGQWLELRQIVRAIELVVVAVNLIACYQLFAENWEREPRLKPLSLDLGILSVLGSRTNALASFVDSAESQLGIDLRSTWALTVVRSSAEPLVVGLCAVGWLTTSLTVVRVEEQALVERLGVPVAGPALAPGLHLHWPWPVDRVIRIASRRVQVLTVGHEGAEEESSGPEDVLWARQHAANEYTLLLGDGRDLITVDAAVQFRIADARAWHYHSQNPADALRAIAHRAVMRTTVNRTLAEALSENMVEMTARMRAMVQSEADALGLGVELLGFTVGGMHPPVAVAADYQSVVSAELGKVTSIVNAQAYRNRIVPVADTLALIGSNTSRADGALALGRAAGEASGFRTVQAQYQAAPSEYMFRRRLEALEKTLLMRRFTILDFRIQRDGGEVWVTQ
jgi:regulator of protease activity HflC (stomatin/prohibitin superfamily)